MIVHRRGKRRFSGGKDDCGVGHSLGRGVAAVIGHDDQRRARRRDRVRQAPRRRALLVRPGGKPAVWALIVAMAAGALALTLLHLRHLPALGPHPRPSWWVLAVAFAVAELGVVHIEFRRNVHIFTVSELPLVFGLIFATPSAILLGILVGPIVVLVANRGQSPVKVAFNVSLFCLGAALAATIFHALLPARGLVDPAVWGTALVATLANAVLGALLVSAAVRLSGQPVAPGKLGRTLAVATAVCVTNTCLALGGAAAVATDARAAVLLVVPAGAIVLAYRAYTAERRKHESLEFLHEVTRVLAHAPDIAAGLAGLLQRTLDVFRGDVAEIILLPPDQRADPLRTALEQGGEVQPMGPADRHLADALRALVDHDTPALLLERPLADPQLDSALALRGIQRAMVAALPGETRMVGTFLVAHRANTGTFDAHDLTLFGTLANHASVSLEYDRLEHVVSQLRELQGQLEHQAYHDPLTGLANRALFLERVGELLESGRRDYTVLFLDLDDFKTVNDSLGHAVGDELLEAVAGRLRGTLKADDVAARLGGDEFAVLLHHVHDGEDVNRVADRVIALLGRPFSVAGHEITAHASLGIVEGWTADVRDAEELLHNADVAMYTAKNSGKDRHEVFEPAMHAAVLRRQGLKDDLERAIELGQLVVELQPIVELDTGNIAAAEALVRWNHPERGRMAPGEFIDVAEESGRILDVDRFVLEYACRQAARWPSGESGAVGLHVNVSPRELQRPELIRRVSDALESTGLPPSQLVLEITESGLMRDPRAVLGRLQALRELGVRLAIDDFGTGYSSLSYLRWMPIDVLKMAKSFVDDLGPGAQHKALAGTIAGLSRTLGLTTVAEGIERPEQADTLHGLECELGQGFLFSPPLHPSSFAALLLRRCAA
jgi:diguanylate cyclase (GGDEF)-like protein